MRQALKALAGVIGVLLIALVAAFVWGRVRPPMPAQSEALKLLQPSPMSAGRNAWPALWLIDYDVPADRIDAVYAQERARMQAWVSQMPASPSTTDAIYKPLVATQYPKRPPIDRKLICASAEADCLAKVRAEGQPLRDLLTQQAGRLAQVESMNTANALWDDLPVRGLQYAQWPDFADTEDLLLTTIAVDFVDGRQAQSLGAACRQALSVRRLHAHTNTLITSMVGIMWMEADERLLASMLRELPSDQSIPDECMRAFAPPAQADISLCAPMQHQFEVTASTVAVVVPDQLHGIQRLKMVALLDARGFRRLLAPTYAWACQQNVQIAALADQRFHMSHLLAVRYDVFDAVSNAIGLILARIAAPAYTQYAARNQDYAASLRIMDWLLRTRATAMTAADWQQQLAKALPALRESGNRNISIDPDGRFLRMGYYAPRAGRTELVLPLMK